MNKLSRCGLWIDASLVLNFRRPAADSYRQLKVDHELIDAWAHDYPYFTWLLGPGGSQRPALQAMRDSLFNLQMNGTTKPKVTHRAGFHLAKLFEEAGGRVAISSHESEEALQTIAQFCGLQKAELFPYKSKAQANESFQKWNRSGLEFAYVLERQIHLGPERKIAELLADKGIILNVKTYTDLRTVVSGGLSAIERRKFVDV